MHRLMLAFLVLGAATEYRVGCEWAGEWPGEQVGSVDGEAVGAEPPLGDLQADGGFDPDRGEEPDGGPGQAEDGGTQTQLQPDGGPAADGGTGTQPDAGLDGGGGGGTTCGNRTCAPDEYCANNKCEPCCWGKPVVCYC